MLAKITYGIKNVHYAKITEDEYGNVAFGEVKRMAGAVELSLPPIGDASNVYSEGVRYFHLTENQGYDGFLNVYQVPDDFYVSHLGEFVDGNGVVSEKAVVEPSNFVLLGEFQSDAGGKRFALYNIAADRVDFGSNSKTGTAEAKIYSIPIFCMPTISDDMIKSTITKEANEEIYNRWFESVYYNPVEY